MKKLSLFFILTICLVLNVLNVKADEACSGITDTDKKTTCLNCVSNCPRGNETAYNECYKSCQNQVGQTQATRTGFCSKITDIDKQNGCIECVNRCTGDKNSTAYNQCYTSCQSKFGQSQAVDPDAAQEKWAENYVGNYVKCGNSGPIPSALPQLSRILINIVEILVPIALIILGMIDFTKAVMGSDADFLDKAKKKFVRRVIAAVAIFFVFVLVKFVVSNISSDSDASKCLECFINKASSCSPATYNGEFSNAAYDE